MEQRIGPIIQPMQTAGTDPAYIPGITSPRPEEAKEAEKAEPPEKAGQPEAAEPPSPDAARGAGATGDAREEDADEEPVAEPEESPEAAPDGAVGDAEGPVFEVSDHRGSITADRTGITFRLDGETAEFDWDEIGAVEVGTPRFSRLLTVTVCTTGRRWYEAYVQASAKSVLKQWTAQLDVVLDACFEDGPDSADSARK